MCPLKYRALAGGPPRPPPGPAMKIGSITVNAEETIATKMAITMRLRCSNLISRIIENGSPIPICKTEVVNNNLDPVWKPLCITMQQYVSKVKLANLFSMHYSILSLQSSLYDDFCSSNCLFFYYILQDNSLVIECFDFNINGNHTLIG
ncbi:putative protein BONZAI [Helianthus anomalus]